VRRTMATPVELAFCPSVASCLYATLYFLLSGASLSFISVWSPTFLSQLFDELWRHRARLCDDVEAGRITFHAAGETIRIGERRYDRRPARASALRQIFSQAGDISECVRAIWPRLSLVSCWADGPSTTYANSLRDVLDGIEMQPKGLLATEAIVSVPLTSQPAGAVALRSHFFEFLPASPAAAPVLAHDLEVGRRYGVVATTQGGLYRYRMNDEIEVVGRYFETPLIRFVGKTDSTSDLVGEKLSAAQIESAITAGFKALGISPRFAQMAAERHPPGYVLHVCDESLEADGALSRRLCHLVQGELVTNPAYQYAIDLGQLAPLRVHAIGRSEADALVANHISRRLAAGQRWGDVKMPTLISLI